MRRSREHTGDESEENDAFHPEVLPESCSTILGPHDFVVIVRARRQRGSPRAAGAWTVAGIADNATIAEAMAGLIMSSEPRKEARALSHATLFHKVDGADRERIVELLDNRTTADIARGDALREAARAWLEAAEAPLSRFDQAESPAESRTRSAKPAP